MLPCKYPEIREKLVREFDIRPIAHVRLLNGQERRSCTGDRLIDSYYCFTYRKNKDDAPETFFCGSHAAKHFLALLNHPGLPLFDPLAYENSGSKTRSTNESMDSKEIWHPAAKQLYNAINLLIICWGIVPGDALQDIKARLEKYKNREPFLGQIKALNKIISKDKRGRTLQQMIEELRDRNDRIRHFKFDLLNEILSKNNIEKSYFC